ncbi:hypothetical protein BDZ97DRAFT_1916853 [Flammula alnicola]|nr:hypothetical protein BDZ97DRAFT_1916853 [Flammula alnicola]
MTKSRPERCLCYFYPVTYALHTGHRPQGDIEYKYLRGAVPNNSSTFPPPPSLEMLTRPPSTVYVGAFVAFVVIAACIAILRIMMVRRMNRARLNAPFVPVAVPRYPQSQNAFSPGYATQRPLSQPTWNMPSPPPMPNANYQSNPYFPEQYLPNPNSSNPYPPNMNFPQPVAPVYRPPPNSSFSPETRRPISQLRATPSGTNDGRSERYNSAASHQALQPGVTAPNSDGRTPTVQPGGGGGTSSEGLGPPPAYTLDGRDD